MIYGSIYDSITFCYSMCGLAFRYVALVNEIVVSDFGYRKASAVNDMELNIIGQTIKPTPCVQLLGAFIDNQLQFHECVSKLCIGDAR